MNMPEDKTLKAYLTLPVEEYSLLDPHWIERDITRGPNAFKLTVPLSDWLGIDVDFEPVLNIRVRRNRRRHKVILTLDDMISGNSDLDTKFSIKMKSVLYSSRRQIRWNIPFSNSGMIDALLDDVKDLEMMRMAGLQFSNDINEDTNEEIRLSRSNLLDYNNHKENFKPVPNLDIEDDAFETRAMSKYKILEDEIVNIGNHVINEKIPYDEIIDDDEIIEKDKYLNFRTIINITVAIPPALSMVPKMIVGPVLQIILRSAINAALPNVLDMIAKDYQDWVTGDRDTNRTIGKLFSDDNN